MKTAHFSRCGKYRYSLTRCWGDGPVVTWILRSPTTGDEKQDSKTIRLCIEFSKRWGCGAMYLVNMYDLKNMDKNSSHYDNPIGEENDDHIRRALISSDKIICAWGAKVKNLDRVEGIKRLILQTPITPECLGTTRNNNPRQPDRIAYETPLRDYHFLCLRGHPAPVDTPAPRD